VFGLKSNVKEVAMGVPFGPCSKNCIVILVKFMLILSVGRSPPDDMLYDEISVLPIVNSR
jgi:hypothetical protein